MAAEKDKLAGSILKSIQGDRRPKPGQKPAAPAEPESKHPLIPGGELLGRGYNVVTEGYASPTPPMRNLFDFSADGTVDQQVYDESLPQVRDNVESAFTTMPAELKLIYARPARVQFTPLYEARLDFSEGDSLSAQQKELSAQVGIEGDFGLFAAEFSARYKSSGSRLATTKFYSATASIKYWSLSMANYPVRPVDLILPDLRKDLNDSLITPDKLFEQYGTHYLYAVTIGSMIVYGHTIDTSKTTSSYDASAELKARYGDGEAGVGGSGGTETAGASEQAADAEEVTFYARGISDAQLKAAENADTKPLAILGQAWHNPTLIDIPDGGLKPIWDLCDAPGRRDELQKAFDAYATAHGSIVGGDANLAPLYLCSHPQHPSYYLFSTNRNERTLDSTTWKEATGDPEAKPWLYVFSEEQPDTVPLYEYAVPGFDTFFRYETSEWDSYMAFYSDLWKKSSGHPVGWVYGVLQSTPSAPAAGVQDIYAYHNTDPDNSGFLHSTDNAEGRDKGSWQPDVPPTVDQDGLSEWTFSHDDQTEALNKDQTTHFLPPQSDKQAHAIVGLSSNVHWRAPTL